MKNKTDNNDDWLLDAEVQTRVVEEKGRWVVSLVFIDTKDPSRILVNEIADYRSKRLAEIAALNMKQTAEKDPRGTQKVKKDDYDINNN
ncbi:hypothetical protein [Flagellimonas meridianipacifica]|uniref:Uncharacterized protein n=1 Tax=Flagellimonas meridianipacifica TaxID=1080225 RepID=A0A2T0MIU3_9FLAO|nr:hypothetical protein [Allomuricauda pacifica]PRX57479.1 hypothetical protein CLV81_1484 [Allomuricauda pacifica]